MTPSPPPGLSVCRSQRLPRPHNLRLPPSSPPDPSSGAPPLRSRSFRLLFCGAIPPSLTAGLRCCRPSASDGRPPLAVDGPEAVPSGDRAPTDASADAGRLHPPPEPPSTTAVARRRPPQPRRRRLHPPRPHPSTTAV